MGTHCRIQMLGGLCIHAGGRTIRRFRTQKTGALLAYLAYHRGQVHPREVLADLLWPWGAPDAARANLRVALCSLRRQLEPPDVPPGAVIIADRNAIGLSPEIVSTDVGDFEQTLNSLNRARGGAGARPGLRRPRGGC